jgi:hypothetical protein
MQIPKPNPEREETFIPAPDFKLYGEPLPLRQRRRKIAFYSKVVGKEKKRKAVGGNNWQQKKPGEKPD